jgi:hypothetical protein
VIETTIERLGYVTPEELAVCRQDPAWEARQGISDSIVCRECGAITKTAIGGKTGHLSTRHRMTVVDYHSAHPGARLCSFKYVANKNRCDIQNLMKKVADRYVTPQELYECQKDVHWEKNRGITGWVVCRECGAKRSALFGADGHLSQHGWTLREYHVKYPGAPWRNLNVIIVHKLAGKRCHSKAMATPERKTRLLAQSRRWRKEHPELAKKHQAKYRAKPEIKKKKAAYHSNYRARIWAIVRAAQKAGITGEGTDGKRKPKRGRDPKYTLTKIFLNGTCNR